MTIDIISNMGENHKFFPAREEDLCYFGVEGISPGRLRPPCCPCKSALFVIY
jgi:hypothetical protein